MNEIAAIPGIAAPAPPTAPAPADGARFRAALDAAGRDSDAVLRKAAQQLVSTALLQPLLAEARASSMAAGPFAAGDAERRFAPLLEEHLADRVTTSAGFDLVDAIVDRIRPGGRP